MSGHRARPGVRPDRARDRRCARRPGRRARPHRARLARPDRRAPGASAAGGDAGGVLLLDRVPQVGRRLAEDHPVPLLADRPGAGRSDGALEDVETLIATRLAYFFTTTISGLSFALRLCITRALAAALALSFLAR